MCKMHSATSQFILSPLCQEVKISHCLHKARIIFAASDIKQSRVRGLMGAGRGQVKMAT